MLDWHVIGNVALDLCAALIHSIVIAVKTVSEMGYDAPETLHGTFFTRRLRLRTRLIVYLVMCEVRSWVGGGGLLL